MQKKLLFLRVIILFFPFHFSAPTRGESQPKILIPRSTQPAKPPPKMPSPKPRPNSAQPEQTMDFPDKNQIKSSTFESVSFSALFGTPLIYENFYEKRFSAFGNFYLFSIPLVRMNRSLFLHIETGPSFTFSKLSFENPPQSYNHLFLTAPARFRLIYSVSKNFHLETFAGVMLRPIEYDSRKTTDGGTHSVKGPNFITADFGAGVDYNVSPPLKIRVLAGYLFLAGGLELTL